MGEIESNNRDYRSTSNQWQGVYWRPQKSPLFERGVSPLKSSDLIQIYDKVPELLSVQNQLQLVVNSLWITLSSIACKLNIELQQLPKYNLHRQ